VSERRWVGEIESPPAPARVSVSQPLIRTAGAATLRIARYVVNPSRRACVMGTA